MKIIIQEGGSNKNGYTCLLRTFLSIARMGPVIWWNLSMLSLRIFTPVLVVFIVDMMIYVS